ncbi:hypothetical protein LCGC14_1624540 [marine sediment metagenome]|uniref:Trimethylamine methyltransferase n=1 Tax=marine sediment metagenome TaxID=412755 RepID=A0A0F9I4R2_9ZZZZ
MSRLILRVLSESEVERLHTETLRVLAEVGFRVTHGEALAKFRRAGALVNEADGTVRVPPEMVKELLAQAPSSAAQTGLNGEVLDVGGDNRYYTSLIIDPFIVDHTDGVRRPVLEDVRRHTIIGESLERVSAMMRMQYPVSDIAEPDSCYKTMEVFLLHSTKHTVIAPTSDKNCRDWMDVMAAIAEAAGLDPNGTPLMSVAMAVTSPLQVHGPNIEIMKMAMERSYPIRSTVCPMAGTTAPYSVAGTMLIANTEALIPVLIAQVYRPGHPVAYGIGPSITDMHTGHDLYYKPEKMLFKIAATQMGTFYNLPVSGEAGGTMTWRADVQNGAESFAYLLASHAGRQNIIGGLGSLHNANGMSAEQIIMQCGLVDMAEYLAGGMDFSDKKLAFDSIRKAGPGGQYLTDNLTLELLRSREFFHSLHLDLTGGYDLTARGAYEMAHQRAEDLVAQHEPTVPSKVQAAIRSFFREKYQDKSVADK